MKRSILIVVVLCIACVILGACNNEKGEQKGTPTMPSEIVTVENNEISSDELGLEAEESNIDNNFGSVGFQETIELLQPDSTDSTEARKTENEEQEENQTEPLNIDETEEATEGTIEKETTTSENVTTEPLNAEEINEETTEQIDIIPGENETPGSGGL